jgi:hypothetical protein
VKILEHPLTTARIYADKQFDFGVALKLLKSGYRVYRNGWNGKGAFVCYMPGETGPLTKKSAEASGIEEATVVNFMPRLLMKLSGAETAITFWSPSTADVLAEDWMVSW